MAVVLPRDVHKYSISQKHNAKKKAEAAMAVEVVQREERENRASMVPPVSPFDPSLWHCTGTTDPAQGLNISCGNNSASLVYKGHTY